jgi:hypothetical protein
MCAKAVLPNRLQFLHRWYGKLGKLGPRVTVHRQILHMIEVKRNPYQFWLLCLSCHKWVEGNNRKGVPFTESVDELVRVIRNRTVEMTDMADKCPICQGSPLCNFRCFV